jgi:hypothetical protein
VVTVVVYSTAPFMLAKVVDGTSGLSQLQKLVILVVDGKHLVFDFIQRWTPVAVANMQEYFSFLCGSWWWF